MASRDQRKETADKLEMPLVISVVFVLHHPEEIMKGCEHGPNEIILRRCQFE